MIKKIDKKIIVNFIEANMERFNKFCIDECIGTADTGAATLNNLKEYASQQENSADGVKQCNFCKSYHSQKMHCRKCGKT